MSNLPNTLPEWLALIESRHAETVINMGLDRVRAVKERMALAFKCPVIMVAGTNGKGSTCAMLESILLQGGYRVGLYIKPHFLHA
jgi:dihydrofolate synthase/folylpolyglutamate synthase